MKKYRIKHHDTSLLFFTPFAFLNMDGTDVYNIEQRKGWWIFGKWEIIYRSKNIVDAYIEYFRIVYDLNIKRYLEFPHNKNKNKKQTCILDFKYDSHPISPEYTYTVGYKPSNYSRYYHACYSSESYEQALMKLWCDLEIKKILDINKSYVKVEKQRRELEKIELEPKIY